jgi:tryptophan-rich sensory protein
MSFVNKDFAKCAAASLIPWTAGMAVNTYFANNKKMTDLWKNLKKPSWAPTDIRVYMVGDALTTLPIGGAAYLVYKEGGGFDDTATATALGVYGANFVIGAAITSAFLKRKFKLAFGGNVALCGTAIATTVLFYKIHNHAGMMMLPLALWSVFGAFFSGGVCSEECKASAEKKE